MYATIQDMLAAFGREEMVALTDLENTGNMVEAVALEAIARASSEADSYLSARYVVPVAVVDKVLTDVVCQIARYRLPGGQVNETDPIQERYDRAIKWLERVANGDANLPGMQDPAATAGDVLFSTGRRVWLRANEETDD
ncbi:MAG: DUF1320 domain-containing protein [Desulfovibrio sp.]|nr:DUF1320 domain-containing protein [Desulfovibrio sp.]MBI4960415.1 DUF1320 domain-containing protein [Desulfovibrio sp.]